MNQMSAEKAEKAETGGTLRGLRGPVSALVLFLAFALLQGCAGYKANLALKAVAEPEKLGQDAPVAVEAHDGRKDPVVCVNSGAMGMASQVTLAPGVENQLARAASALLAEKGFAPDPASATATTQGGGEVARKLSVTLTALSCKNAFGSGETVTEANAALTVAVDNNGHPDERRYEGKTVWRLDGDNMEPDYDRLLSQTISKALARLGADYDFLNDLASVKLRSKDLQ